MRPSLMRQATLGSVSTDTLLTEQLLSPPSDGLYLGATADTVSDPTINVDQQVSSSGCGIKAHVL